MDSQRLQQINLDSIRTPCYLIDEAALERNLEVLRQVQERTGCKVLLALKAFAMVSTFPLLRTTLAGTCASSLHEAMLGREAFGKEVHIYAPAYGDQDMNNIIEVADKIIFNSVEQWQKYRSRLPGNIDCGYRINPEYSEVDVDLYNPCAKDSRLGIPLRSFPEDLNGISGLHFHALCEQNADTLQRVLKVIEKQFGYCLPQMKWINFGGGHHITRLDYDLELLIALIADFQERYDLQVYLEPGEAIALNAGTLIASVLDIIDHGCRTAILDTSAETQMPDVLAMPYRPEIQGAGEKGKYAYEYRLAGVTCLAGDVIGDYSFPEKLKVGDRIIFLDMAHYTMVKNTTFNGIRLPSLSLMDRSGSIRVVRDFEYEDFRSRLQ